MSHFQHSRMFKRSDENAPPHAGHHVMSDVENFGVGKHKSVGGVGDAGERGTQEPAHKRVALSALTNVTRSSVIATKKLTDKVAVSKFKDVAEGDKENFALDHGYYHSSSIDQCQTEVISDRSLLLQRPVLSSAQDMDTEYDDSVDLLSFESNLSDDEDREVVRDNSLCERQGDGVCAVAAVDTDAAFEERLDRLVTLAEYKTEIYTYLREAELRYRAKPNYMRKQPDITSHMRCIMIDWMVEVAEEYRLTRETLFLAVNYVDRFLSQMSVLRGKLQLVGTAAMFIASKYEEIYPPEVKEFAYITDDTYTLQQVIRMEYLMLRALSFDVAAPTTNCFCERYLKESGADERTVALAMYLIELTLLDDLYLEFLPSVVASSAICLANYTLSDEPWTDSLRESTGYDMVDFEPCLRMLHQSYCATPSLKHQSIRSKYSHSRFYEVAKILAPSFLML